MQFCASLDAVEDTELACDAFLSLWQQPHGGGSAVLWVYGVLQCLLVQQDAAKWIEQHATGRKHKKLAQLEDIRATRNVAAGHPGKEAGFLVHVSLTREKPELLVPARGSRKHEMKELDFAEMIREQRSALTTLLQGVAVQLDAKDMEHMRKYSSKPLAPTVRELTAALDGVAGELWKTSDAAGPLLPIHLKATDKALAQLEHALAERGELEARSDTLPDAFKFARHCLRRLAELDETGARGERRDDAQAFLEALRHRCDGLSEVAARLDAEYRQGSN